MMTSLKQGRFYFGLKKKSAQLRRLWRLLPGSIAALIVLGLFQIGAWQPLENLFCDMLFSLRGFISWGDQVVVVEIDDASLQSLGQFPWNRHYYAEVLDALTDAHASVVALDVVLSDPTPEDEQLASAMRRQGRVVLAQSWNQAGAPILPTATLKSAAIATGHNLKREELDGAVRQVDLLVKDTPSLALAAVQIYSAVQKPVSLPNLNQPLWVNWLGPSLQATQYSFVKVLRGDVPAQAFAGKVVLVGVSTPALDSVQTPYNRNPSTSSTYLQATVINNLLQENPLHRVSDYGLVILLLLGGPGLSYVLGQFRLDKQILAWSALCLGWFGLSICLFRVGYWLPTIAPISLFCLTGAGVVLADQYRMNKLLHQSEERYALAVRGSNEGLWDWNLKTDVIYFSPRWKEILGYDEEESGDRSEDWFSRVHSDDLEQLKVAIDNHLKGKTAYFEHEHRIRHCDGNYRWVLSRGMAVRNSEGMAYRMAGSQTDVTERREAEEQLRRIALYDGLTDLPNRAYFMDALRQAIAHNQEQPLFTFAVFFLDVDRFQLVNSSLGNSVGDQLLVAIAHRLKAYISPEGIVARLGGDEFAMLLKHVEDMGDAIREADQIQRLLSLPFNLEGHEVFTTVSIGIALSANYYTQPEHILRDADTAMYRAKASGKARHQVFDKAMHTRMVAKLQLENDLRRAISNEERQVIRVSNTNQEFHELQLHYQPIVQLTTGRVVGFEALVRWQHPEQGFLSPAKFIATAEETGLIIPLGWWILRQACLQMSAWQEKISPGTPLTINVNLASRQFSMRGLTEQMDYILQETGINASRLKLEITEGTIMNNAKSVIATLHQLRSLGIQLAIDDFGTGYSSLSYLHRFPINTLKIDRSFVSRMSIDSENAEIVRTIVTLAHTLNMDVTAEGVENTEQSLQLLEMGCEYGQGYLFARPLTAEAATQLLAEKLWGRESPTTLNPAVNLHIGTTRVSD